MGVRSRLRRWTLYAFLLVTAGALWVPRHPPRRIVADALDDAPSQPRVRVLMFSTPSIMSHAAPAAEINAAYARRHGYDFVHVVAPVRDRDEALWKKVELLRAHHGRADALFWINSDAVFNPARHDKTLEWLFAERGDILGCSDYPNGDSGGVISTGTLLVKNTPVAAQMLDMWWAARDGGDDDDDGGGDAGPGHAASPFPEQRALDRLAHTFPSAVRARPADEFNSVWTHLKAGRRDAFVLHFVAHAYSDEERGAEIDRLRVDMCVDMGTLPR